MSGARKRTPPALWFPVLLATVAVVVLWRIDASDLAESAKAHLKSVVTRGFALAIAAFLAMVSVLVLPWYLGIVLAGSLLWANGAWDIAGAMLGPGGGSGGATCPPGFVLDDDSGVCLGFGDPGSVESEVPLYW